MNMLKKLLSLGLLLALQQVDCFAMQRKNLLGQKRGRSEELRSKEAIEKEIALCEKEISDIKASMELYRKEGHSQKDLAELFGEPLTLARVRLEALQKELVRIQEEEKTLKAHRAEERGIAVQVVLPGAFSSFVVEKKLFNFPSDAHAHSGAEYDELKKLGFDITGVNVNFVPQGRELDFIRSLFRSSYGYKERETFGTLLEGGPHSDGSAKDYFESRFVNSADNRNLLIRFMLLNSKAIFYRDLNEYCLSGMTSKSQQEANFEKNGNFSQKLIDYVGYLYEVKNQEMINTFKDSVSGLNILKMHLGCLKDTQKVKIDALVKFILAAAKKALEHANALFSEYGLPII